MGSNTFAELKNDRILRAARGLKVDRAPVWVMRQAGRYLPEYKKVKGDRDFFECCRDPEIASEITIQPIKHYKGLLDAAIIFSDILVIPQALGLDVQMVEKLGPVISHPIRTPEDLNRLNHKADVKKELGWALNSITYTRKKLEGEVPLLGFCGGPWTLLVYMVEGGGGNEGGGSMRIFRQSKTFIYKYPEAAHKLLSLTTDVIVSFLVEQVEAGAQMVQVFESWAGELGPDEFDEFVLPYLKDISKRVRLELRKRNLENPLPTSGIEVRSEHNIPLTIFAKGAWYSLEKLSNSGYDVISLDWTVDPLHAINETKGKVTLQGNLDPGVIYSSKELIQKKTRDMIHKFGGGKSNYIANLGHGTSPFFDPDMLGYFLKAINES